MCAKPTKGVVHSSHVTLNIFKGMCPSNEKIDGGGPQTKSYFNNAITIPPQCEKHLPNNNPVLSRDYNHNRQKLMTSLKSVTIYPL